MTSSALEIARQTPAARTHGVANFAPNSFSELLQFADLLANSDIVPKQYKGKKGDVVVAIQYGAELGIPPMGALNSVCVINGRPSLFGDGFLAVILAQPDCEAVEEQDLPEIAATKKAVCTIKRRGRKPITRTFTMEDAVKANLAGKEGPWKAYPARMLQMRARGFAGRDAYADVFRGMKIYEEVIDYPAQDALPSIEVLPPDNTPITQDQAREFGRAWKGTGKTIDQAKAYLRDLGIESSLKIPARLFEQAMKWANGTQQQSQTETATATDSTAAQASPEEKLCRELFGILNYTEEQQAAAIAKHNTNWKSLAEALSKELPEDK